MKPVVFIQTNARQLVGAIVSSYSLKRNSSNPDAFDVRIMHHKDYPYFAAHEGKIYWRGPERLPWHNDDLQSFTLLRFMPPELMGYEGRALVIDPDIFAVGDVWELLSRDMEGKALMCRWRPPSKGVEGYLASSAMLLDCAQLRHWRVQEQFEQMFRFERDYLKWTRLEYEPPESIGLFEPEWNDFDQLTERTKMVHNTGRNSQPWKTGLPVDYTIHELTKKPPSLKKRIKRLFKPRVQGVPEKKLFYQPHPDPRQEQFFFGLLRECLEKNIVTEDLLREEMKANHIRHDALEMIERTKGVPELAAA